MILLALLWDKPDESALDEDSDPTARPGDSQRGAPHAEPRKDENHPERLTPLAPVDRVQPLEPLLHPLTDRLSGRQLPTARPTSAADPLRRRAHVCVVGMYVDRYRSEALITVPIRRGSTDEEHRGEPNPLGDSVPHRHGRPPGCRLCLGGVRATATGRTARWPRSAGPRHSSGPPTASWGMQDLDTRTPTRTASAARTVRRAPPSGASGELAHLQPRRSTRPRSSGCLR